MAEGRNRAEEITGRIVTRAEKLIDRGENLFPARSFMSGLAIWAFLDDHPEVSAVLRESNAGIMRALLERGAEGMVFADRMDLGNGYQDTTDFVAVTARDGAATPISPSIYGELVIRDTTPDAQLTINSKVV